jgi:hypothetical protein
MDIMKLSRDNDNGPSRLDMIGVGHEFHYWRGAGGRRYLHSVYSLAECPEIPAVNYIIVRRGDNGERIPVHIGRTLSQTRSLNLAFVRHIAARNGASEVHIHVLTENDEERRNVELDLRRAQGKAVEKDAGEKRAGKADAGPFHDAA